MDDRHSLDFPDEPRGELDLALDNLVARAHDVLAIQGRLRSLLKANQTIVEQLDLPVLLERTVAAAVELVGAHHGALGVAAPDGTLEHFVTVGMTPEQIAAIGGPPEGTGLLSIPVRVRDEVYGTLYLSSENRGSFSADDEQLVVSLAATAGVAIENARLYAETRRHQAWSAASAEFTANLLSPENGSAVATLAVRILELSDADIVWVLLPAGAAGEFVVDIARGLDARHMEGAAISPAGTLFARILEGGEPHPIDDGRDLGLALSDGQALGPAMAVPLTTAGLAQGVLLVARMTGGQPFALTDLDMAADFAGQASVAMELESARAYRQRMTILEDRGRIARDLHDHVIQQLFGTGLELQSIVGAMPMGPLSDRIVQSVTNLDASISQIRTIIFALSAQTDAARNTVRHWIIDLANELAPLLESTPAVSFSGPVDLIVIDDLADDVLAVTRESLVNIIKHAGAAHASVSLGVRRGEIFLEITDDGHGFDGSQRRSGVANLEHRANDRGGSLTLDSSGAGTRLLWQVPYETVRV